MSLQKKKRRKKGKSSSPVRGRLDARRAPRYAGLFLFPLPSLADRSDHFRLCLRLRCRSLGFLSQENDERKGTPQNLCGCSDLFQSAHDSHSFCHGKCFCFCGSDCSHALSAGRNCGGMAAFLCFMLLGRDSVSYLCVDTLLLGAFRQSQQRNFRSAAYQ